MTDHDTMPTDYELWVYENERHGLFTHAEFDGAMQSIHDGTSSPLYPCPIDGTLEGVAREGRTPGTPRDFAEGTWTELRCGHVIV